jgi:hypothetical protein
MKARVVILLAALCACSSSESSDGTTCVRAGEPPEGESVKQGAIFADDSLRDLRSCFTNFTPAYPLWTDGKPARRWLFVPPGRKIDTRDPEHFLFPVGTRALKQYSAPDGRPIELRVVERTKSGYLMGSYVYTADGKDALYTERGSVDNLGLSPPHEVPSSAQCNNCHGGEPGRMLAFSAVQLGRGGTPTLADFVSRGVLALDNVAQYALPAGDEVAWRAMGRLHADCGHCHSDTGRESQIGITLRLEAKARPLAETAFYKTTVHQKLTSFSAPGVTERIVPGDPAKSGLFVRLSTRGTTAEMPPLGTLLRSDELERDVSQWISEMRP